MDEKDRINYAKSELKNLRYLQRVVLGFNNKLDEINNQLIGVSGINPSRESSGGSSGNGNSDARYLALLDKKQRIIIDRAPFAARVTKIISFLDGLPIDDRKIVTDVYIKGYTIESVSIWLYCSERTVKYRIDRILYEF